MGFIIYKHTSPSGKSYIGLTSKTMEERLNGHVNHAIRGASTSFHQSIRKYGIESFKSEVLIDSIETLLEAESIEIFYISFYNTYKCGYNDTRGGRGTSVDYRFFDQEWRNNISKSRIGIKLSQEHKDNISKSCSGEKNGMYGRTGETNPNFGKTLSEETKEKIKKSNIGQTRTEETKQNIKIACLNRDRSTRGKHIQIFNNNHELQNNCLGTFTEICKLHKYDIKLFRESFKNNSTITHKKFNNWYCLQL